MAHKTTLLNDNGPSYISEPFNEYLETIGIRHIFAARRHPQTVGKFERLNRTAKSRLRLVVHGSPGELEEAVSEFAHWYNHERYHEAIGSVRPIDMYKGRAEEILARRKEVQAKTFEERRKWNLQLNCQME